MKVNRFYRFARAIVWAVLKVFFPSRVIGAHNIPAEGPVLLCCNHVSMLDPLFLACSTKRQITYLAKKELFGNAFTNWLFRALGMVPVDRGASDIQALRTCLEVLAGGGLLGIFPQGHRYRQDESREIQNGAAMMALRSKATVIAAHVIPFKMMRCTTVRYSEPIDLSDMTRASSQALQTVSERIALNIWQEDK